MTNSVYQSPSQGGPWLRGQLRRRLPRRQRVLQKNLYSTFNTNERPRGSATRGSQELPEPKLLS